MTKPIEEDEDYAERSKTWTSLDHMEPLMKLLKGNLGIIFTNHDLTDMKNLIDRHAREAPAKVGAVTQSDVWTRAGPAGLDPKQTGFFQNLQIPTKIVKTQIEIRADKQIIFEGEKIGGNEAALLKKLNIDPFSYKLKVAHVFDNGKVYGPGVLDIIESILASYKRVVSNVASISLELGIPTKASVPHSIMRVFKNFLAVTYEIDYTFEAAEILKNAAATASVVQSAPKVEEKAAEKPEEVDGPGNIFGEDDDY
jgi:large subunit ribosomal protein LP0